MRNRRETMSGRFSDAYRRRMRKGLARGTVGEAAAAAYAGRVEQQGEKLVRCIWFDQYLRSDALRTEDGRRLEVLSPGWWNADAGPDFQNAEFRLGGGETVRADVEVHIRTSDWYRHGHERDLAYARVALHVVLENDTGDSFVAACGGARIPQVVATKFLTQELEDIAEAAVPETRPPAAASAGGCRQAVQKAGGEWAGRFLDEAGDERILRKAENFEAELASRTLDDVLLEGVLDALGYRNNRVPFRRLARRLPTAELRRFVAPDAEEEERTQRLEAILFGVAGLLPESVETADEEMRCYHARLRRAWEEVSRELGGRALRRAEWNFRGTRPLNRPERRIAAAARWLARCLNPGPFRALLTCIEEARGRGAGPPQAGAETLRSVQAFFGQERAGYWSRRCRFEGGPLARPARLVGEERARAMMVNVAIPLMLCEARRNRDAHLEGDVHALYVSLRPLAGNFATRYAAGRIFPSELEAMAVVTSARRQQGLLQLHADFCRFPAITCERCLFHAAAQAAQSATAATAAPRTRGRDPS